MLCRQVLGDIQIDYRAGTNAHKSLNSCTQVGAIYNINPSGPGAYDDFPYQNGTGLWGALYVTKSIDVTIQNIVAANTAGSIEKWCRIITSNSNTPWQRNDNYGTTSLAELKAALAAV